MQSIISRWTFFTKKDLLRLTPNTSSTTAGGDALASALKRIERRISDPSQFRFEHDDPDSKAPRHSNWRPFRLTSDGALIGFVALRNRKELGCLEVDALHAVDGPSLPRRAAWRAVLTFTLAEACKRCTMIAASFNDEIPQPIVTLAGELGVELPNLRRRAIGPVEGEQLLWRLAEAAPALRQAAENGILRGRCSLGRLAFLMHAGVWSAAELDAAISWCPAPAWLLASCPDAAPLFDRTRVQYARPIALASVFDALLRAPAVPTTPEALASAFRTPDEPSFRVTTSAPPFVREYHLLTAMRWPEETICAPSEMLAAGATIRTSFVARSAAQFGADAGAGALLDECPAGGAAQPTRVVVVTNDFRQVPLARRSAVLADVRAAGAGLIVAPVSVAELSGRVLDKFTRMQSVRP